MGDLNLHNHVMRAAVISRAAYADTMEAEGREASEVKPIGLMQIGHGTFQALCAEFEDIVIVAVRGTDYEDIRTDLHVNRVATPNGKIHSGFYSYTMQGILQICAYTELVSKPVIFTGHSLGGAAAQILAVWLHNEIPEKIAGLITFGSPRVGDAAFAKSVMDRFEHLRYVNANDAVSYVPWFLGRYKHSHRLCYLTVDGHFWDDPFPPAVFWDRWQGFRRSFWKWASDKISDHRLARYIEKIRRTH